MSEAWIHAVGEALAEHAEQARGSASTASTSAPGLGQLRDWEAAIPSQLLLEEAWGYLEADDIRDAWAAPPPGLPAVLGACIAPAGASFEHEKLPHCYGPSLAGPPWAGRLRPAVVDLVREGPHAMLAGTTGSGKSEFLLSWMLQLAVTHPPSRLCFILVDYKGGAAFGPLEEVPHCAGVLTDLTPALTHRALTSLDAELRRREELTARYAVKSVEALPPEEVPPRIIIAVDEFATLAQSHPDVLEHLVRVAAQGRSLGIHLIVATQRPAGSVSAAMRANTSLRICLRTLDEADSRDVLGHGNAAQLAPIPGRAIVGGLASGSDMLVQGLWCGQEPAVERVVAAICRAASGEGAPSAQGRAWRPWAPPLPQVLDYGELSSRWRHEGATSTTGPSPEHAQPLLLIDEPQSQGLRVWAWDGSEPLLVLGTPRSGKTSTLSLLALSARRSPADRTSRIIHLCGSLTGAVSTGGQQEPGAGDEAATQAAWGRIYGTQAGTLVNHHDPRRLARLCELALSGALHGHLLLMDDADAAMAALEEAHGSGQGAVILEQLIRAAPTLGLSLAIAAPLTSASMRWAGMCRHRLTLGISTPAQAALAGLPRELATGEYPGRGVLLSAGRAYACQVPSAESLSARQAHGPTTPGPTGAHNHARTVPHTSHPTRLMPLPREVTARATGRSNEAPIWAVGGDAATPLPVPTGSVFIIGPAGCGKSTLLRCLSAAEATARRGMPAAGTAEGGAHVQQGDAPIIIDDLDLASPEQHEEVEAAIAAGRRVFASATTERVSSAYRGILNELRLRATLIMLWPALAQGSGLAGIRLRGVIDPRARTLPGRGVLIERGRAIPMQAADDRHKIKDGAV